MNFQPKLQIRFATPKDVPLILTLIKELAAYEKLAHEVVASEKDILDNVFGKNPKAEVIIGEAGGEPVGFALFFHNYSTFLGKSGLYLEDLFICEKDRGKGFGKKFLAYLAKVAIQRKCGRFEWVVLDWNDSAIGFYKSIGAQPVEGWKTFRLSGRNLLTLSE